MYAIPQGREAVASESRGAIPQQRPTRGVADRRGASSPRINSARWRRRHGSEASCLPARSASISLSIRGRRCRSQVRRLAVEVK